ncbi:MAG: Ldh family oxidoreductase [Chloroflexi bacterium]|nr:Ldh family oxidoreductase [Chloroflexota bacterium]
MPQFSSSVLEQYGRGVFAAAGSPPDIADAVACSLVLADLSGHPSHGVMRIPDYVTYIEEGLVDPSVRPSITRSTANTVFVDGHWGFGQITAADAVAEVVKLAKASGIAMAGMMNCNHVGRVGEWVELAAESDVLAIMVVGGPSDIVTAPFGGAETALSTNPIAAGVPAGTRDPMILDFATSAQAVGKIRIAQARGMQLPENSILDSEGNPTTDPDDFFDGGLLLPFGGHKGSALSILIDALGSGMTGSELTDRYNKLGAILIGINPAVFRPRDEYGAAVDGLFDRVTGMQPAPGFDEVLIPGVPERRARMEQRRTGIEVAPATLQTLLDTAEKLGIDAGALSDEP